MTTTGTHSGPNPSAPAPDGVAPEANLESQMDTLLADASARDKPTKPGYATHPAEATVASIEKQVESLVDQFVERATDPKPAPSVVNGSTAGAPQPAANEPSPAPAESIGELDDQLARLTDELLIAPAAEAPPPKPPASSPAPSVVVAIPEPAPVAVPAAPAAPETPAAESAKPSTAPAPGPAPAVPGKLVRVFSKPLAGKPRLVRDTVGWLGFNSMFLAGVVWCYHLWFQKPEKPAAQHAPVALVSADHGESSDQGHGSPADHDPHAVPSDESPAHAATDRHSEHASDEPVTGVVPLHKKKPTYALSNAMAEKLNVAKKSDDGHGGEKKSGSGHGAPPKSGH